MNEYREKLWPTLKHYALHIPALVLCISATVHTMYQLSHDTLFRWYAMAGAVFAGLFAQYLRGRAAAHRERGEKWDGWKAAGCWFIVILYIVVFEMLSFFAVIVSKVDIEEQRYQQVSDIQTELNQELTDIKNDIRAKTEQRNEEFKNKGRGPKYDQFQSEIEKLKKDKIELEAKIKEASQMTKIVSKSCFLILQDKTTIKASIFQIIMSCSLLLMIFLAPLLFPWKVRLEPKSGRESASTDEIKKEKALSDTTIPPSKEIVVYIEALFSEFTTKLNGDLVISNRTGIPYKRCLEYRKWLEELYIGDKPVIVKKQGGSISNFSKDDLIHFLTENWLKLNIPYAV